MRLAVYMPLPAVSHALMHRQLIALQCHDYRRIVQLRDEPAFNFQRMYLFKSNTIIGHAFAARTYLWGLRQRNCK